jgi:hypothetical protein
MSRSSYVWNDEELRREEVRGIFALGVLATILGYLAYSKGFSHPTDIYSQVLYVFLQPFAIVILVLWGGYVLLTAMSLTGWNPTTDRDQLRAAFRFGGWLLFYSGSVVTILFGVFVGISLLAFAEIIGSLQIRVAVNLVIVLVIGLGIWHRFFDQGKSKKQIIKNL